MYSPDFATPREFFCKSSCQDKLPESYLCRLPFLRVFYITDPNHKTTHRPLSSPLLGLPYGIRNINHEKELLRGLWLGV